MKAKVARGRSSGDPYDSQNRRKNARNRPEFAVAPAAAATSAASPAPDATRAPGSILYRDFCLQRVKELYPDLRPRNDYELVTLAIAPRPGTHTELRAWVDGEYAIDVQMLGKEEVDRNTSVLLSTYVEPTGVKPPPGKVSDGVHIRRIPNTEYSIRLFPGSFSAAEYCMDFVDSTSGRPVNSPFDFELWAVPDFEKPWLGMPVVQRIRSIERIFHIKQEDIHDGHEKFILRDGQTCLLKRPGKQTIRFKVPVRRRPAADQQEKLLDLDFPEVVEP
ncbi:hypothetical protein C8Q77DRAFT_782607 [Trametes polyzona]|nr:hypothetical protein C8Q77DRAFT_782607 [Trametes polyzona]